MRAMCGRKVTNKNTTRDRMDMLGLKDTVDELAKAVAIRWCGYVLKNG